MGQEDGETAKEEDKTTPGVKAGRQGDAGYKDTKGGGRDRELNERKEIGDIDKCFWIND